MICWNATFVPLWEPGYFWFPQIVFLNFLLPTVQYYWPFWALSLHVAQPTGGQSRWPPGSMISCKFRRDFLPKYETLFLLATGTSGSHNRNSNYVCDISCGDCTNYPMVSVLTIQHGCTESRYNFWWYRSEAALTLGNRKSLETLQCIWYDLFFATFVHDRIPLLRYNSWNL